MWKRLRRFCTVPEQPFLKHGKWASRKGKRAGVVRPIFQILTSLPIYLLLRIISTKLIMRSICLRADIMPTSRRRLNSRQCSDPVPPITSTNSCVSLKGDCSKPAGRKAKGIRDHIHYGIPGWVLTQILWRYAKNEAEVYVDYMTIRMKEYIAVVPDNKIQIVSWEKYYIYISIDCLTYP